MARFCKGNKMKWWCHVMQFFLANWFTLFNTWKYPVNMKTSWYSVAGELVELLPYLAIEFQGQPWGNDISFILLGIQEIPFCDIDARGLTSIDDRLYSLMFLKTSTFPQQLWIPKHPKAFNIPERTNRPKVLKHCVCKTTILSAWPMLRLCTFGDLVTWDCF